MGVRCGHELPDHRRQDGRAPAPTVRLRCLESARLHGAGDLRLRKNLKLRASLRNNRDGAFVVSSRTARKQLHIGCWCNGIAQELPNLLDRVRFLGGLLPLDGMQLDISIVVSNFRRDRRCPPALPICAKRTGASTPGSQNDGAPCTVAAKPSAISAAFGHMDQDGASTTSPWEMRELGALSHHGDVA